jgi:hypothetical protein
MYLVGIASERVGQRLVGCAGVADDRVVQPVHGSPVASGDQVAVDRQGEGRGMVPELFLDVLEGFARFDQEAGERVAQGVRFAVTEPGPAQDRGPDVAMSSSRARSTPRGSPAPRLTRRGCHVRKPPGLSLSRVQASGPSGCRPHPAGTAPRSSRSRGTGSAKLGSDAWHSRSAHRPRDSLLECTPFGLQHRGGSIPQSGQAKGLVSAMS